MSKIIRHLIALPLLAAPWAVFADDGRVGVASLQVKERLQSIEQINVTAEKERKDIAPESDAVAELLQQAQEIDAEAQAD